ncbi:hypothetical protein [Paenibacillus phytorum]|nr:hypothetical protein [Paenibacillus phytorum]
MPVFDNMSLPAIPQKIVRCQLLDGCTVPFEQNEKKISIKVPKEKWDDRT